ncbi:Hsp20/alpha crystallin family protein [Caldimonas thermodepolymerans]|uniref:Heat shock protein Hsp20 n=1 Tax=Caldimonas thermodepolymerans TaxID=215580 RepID=A0AA46HUY2_9BURK|nr:Hsp20/alpha crystallin family protein [Caldimonas thermodepolymerans]TCP05826.1 heat shock protein Hsp20 [Caldimonas thermodepolymerans]UZG44590.1 Hsp20/alpha crystallin family protein [Caldimonas thermodepolymerans]UZG48234.1 Hsp20/alpha crystallin family protein [Caldimonas thermodepolymerans]
MSALTRFDPRDDLMRFDNFNDLFRRFLRLPDWPAARVPGEIRLDIVEDDKAFQVKAELPGVKREDIRVSVDGNYVSISAESRSESRETKKDGERTLLREMYYGSWSRGFTLPCDVDDGAATATFDNGVLSLTLPKRSPARAKTIEVK